MFNLNFDIHVVNGNLLIFVFQVLLYLVVFEADVASIGVMPTKVVIPQRQRGVLTIDLFDFEVVARQREEDW